MMDFLNTILDQFGKLLGLASPLFKSLVILRAIVGSVLVFFLPGFAWSLIIFRQVNIVERIALSLGLSIALVTLSLLALNVIGLMKITVANSIAVILAISAVPLIIYGVNRYIRQHR